MNKTMPKHDSKRGAALLVAIALVGLFSLLGTAWVNYALLDEDEAEMRVDEVQARQIAASGVYGAIADLQAALAKNDAASLLTAPREYPVPLYRGTVDGVGVPAPDDSRSALASVTITDEAARVNLNFVPPAVLSRILGVSGETARQIRRALPGTSGDGVWLTHVDDLVTRNLMDEAAFSAIDTNHLTVYTVGNPADPAGYINVNTASREVLEAVLDVPGDVATRVMAARPIASLDQLASLTGKDPSSFGVRMDTDTTGSVPKALALDSRCYRIRSQGTINRTETDGTSTPMFSRTVEAVVIVNADGRPQVMYWSDTANKGDEPAPVEEAAEEPAAEAEAAPAA